MARVVKGASQAPWRLPALQSLVGGKKEKWDAGHPGPEQQRTGAAERWLIHTVIPGRESSERTRNPDAKIKNPFSGTTRRLDRIATAASCLRAAPGSRLLPDPGRARAA